jgi:hypothetical protein
MLGRDSKANASWKSLFVLPGIFGKIETISSLEAKMQDLEDGGLDS